MMDEKKIARINELARKAKSEEGLTPEEMVERDLLRQEYVAAYRESLVAWSLTAPSTSWARSPEKPPAIWQAVFYLSLVSRFL